MYAVKQTTRPSSIGAPRGNKKSQRATARETADLEFLRARICNKLLEALAHVEAIRSAMKIQDADDDSCEQSPRWQRPKGKPPLGPIQPEY